MEIRNMLENDYTDVYALWTACSGMGLNDLDDSPCGIAGFLQHNPQTCLVATVEGKIVGAILVGSDGRRGYIYHLAVHPDYRRRGIGKSLVEQALHKLEHIGIHKVGLVVFERNQAGNAFWERLGFIARDDLVYRNKALCAITRIDT